MVFKLTILVAAVVATAFAFPSVEEPAAAPKGAEDGVEGVYSFIRSCGNEDLTMCLKMRALTFVDSVLQQGDISVADGVTLHRTAPVSSKSGRALTQAELESTLPANEEERRKKKKKLLLPLLLALKLKAVALVPLILGGLALLAFKALVVGKIALVLSAIIGLQKLLGGGGYKTYEVVSHPHFDHHDAGHHYGRAIQEKQELAYKAHAPQ
ncbi:hypothetical protein B566_EDAN009220 [Ephemera danica]|nr:hypothetical protein B566_EDAN009220 [Ephemera danica]